MNPAATRRPPARARILWFGQGAPNWRTRGQEDDEIRAGRTSATLGPMCQEMRNEAARYRSEHSDFGSTGLDALSFTVASRDYRTGSSGNSRLGSLTALPVCDRVYRHGGYAREALRSMN